MLTTAHGTMCTLLNFLTSAFVCASVVASIISGTTYFIMALFCGFIIQVCSGLLCPLLLLSVPCVQGYAAPWRGTDHERSTHGQNTHRCLVACTYSN